MTDPATKTYIAIAFAVFVIAVAVMLVVLP